VLTVTHFISDILVLTVSRKLSDSRPVQKMAQNHVVSYYNNHDHQYCNNFLLVWKGILVAVFFLCLFTDISTTVASTGVKSCMMVHIGPGQIFSRFGAVLPGISKYEIFGLNLGHFTANNSKTVSHSVTSIRA